MPAIVNYANFTILPELLDAYSDMVRWLTENFYSGVTSYTTSGFLRVKLGDALGKRKLAPHIYETADFQVLSRKFPEGRVCLPVPNRDANVPSSVRLSLRRNKLPYNCIGVSFAQKRLFEFLAVPCKWCCVRFPCIHVSPLLRRTAGRTILLTDHGRDAAHGRLGRSP